MRQIIPIMAAACALPQDDTPPEDTPPVDGPIEILETTPRVVEPIQGLVIYSMPGTPERADQAPWIRGLFDETTARPTDTLGLRDQCLHSLHPDRLYGVADVGPELLLESGDDEFRLRRTHDYFGKSGVDYMFVTKRPGAGTTAGARLALEGHHTGVTVPAPVVVHHPDQTYQDIVDHQQLLLEWEPDPVEEGSRTVYAYIRAYDGSIATATDSEAVFCYFVDDGLAQVDLSAELPAGWDTYEMRVTRRSAAIAEHPELGRVMVEADRKVRLGPH